MTGTPRFSSHRDIAPDREQEFVARGWRKRFFFPHRILYLPKPGPDGFQLASKLCGPCSPNQLWEVVLYAVPPKIGRLPVDLFFDSDVLWHQQQFGRPGQVATASLVVAPPRLYSTTHVSDLVQRISRRRQYKTRVENDFKGWNHMLLNAVLNFAVEQRLHEVCIPTADVVVAHTDPRRRPNLGRELYSRIYDRQVRDLFVAVRRGDWWAIDVRANQERLVRPRRGREAMPDDKIISVCHDIERGWGHFANPLLASSAHRASPRHLAAMLAFERAANVKATYNVVGVFLPEVRAQITADGHAIGFHSYDHQGADRGVAAALRRAFRLPRHGDECQLPRCRDVDYRIKGYRVPGPDLTPGVSDENLCYHNFEWLAGSAESLGTTAPIMENGVVKIPILFDDVGLHRRTMRYDEWEEAALREIEAHHFVAFSLHDCYADRWLPRYERFLERVTRLGRLATLDGVANEVILAHAG